MAKDGLTARADETLAHAYEQIARADEQLARATEQLSKVARDAPSAQSAPGRRPSRERRALRGLVALLLAACIIGAAFLLQSPYGDAARLLVAGSAPQLASSAPSPLQRPVPAGQSDRANLQTAAADGATVQAATASAETPPSVAPAAAAAPPELTELLQAVQTMARDFSNAKQAIEQLQANQAQMATDNAKTLDQIRTRQEEMTGLIGKVFDQTLRLTSAASSRPTPTQRKPAQVPQSQAADPSRQARALPRTPAQLRPEQ
jgi:hypothetical protein